MAQNTITLQTAQQWATNWRKVPTLVKAHLIPRVDITQLLKEPKVQDVRAYIGVDENGVNKLMLVGVDVNGNDLIDTETNQFIYDFTKPCPSNCDTNSPLFTLK